MVLVEIKEFINKHIQNSEGEIVVEDTVMYGDCKLDYALSIKGYMASISILTDYTYDFFAIDIVSEEMVLYKSIKFNNLKDLTKQLETDLKLFSKINE